MAEVFDMQISVFNRVKEYLTKSEKKNIDISLSPLCFMTTWTKTVGHYKILKLLKIKNFDFINYFIKDILSIGKYHDLEISVPANPRNNNVLIVSYCSKANFNSNGIFKDNYFSYDSNNKNYTWLLISLDNFIPDNLEENIYIFSKKTKKKFSAYFFIKIIISFFFDKNVKIKNIFHYMNSQFVFSKLITMQISKTFKNFKISKLLINYEGIPFQHGIIKLFNKLNKNTKCICYLHCAGWPVQTDLIYREKLIDILLVSGDDQKSVLSSHLNWPHDKIFSIPSLRFNKKNDNELSGCLFIPYEIFYTKHVLNRFEKFLINSSNEELGKISLRIHPLNKNSKKHKNFENKISFLMKKYKDKFSEKKKNISIIFGYATGVCIQALEEGNTIYHFPYNKIIDVFSEEIWHNIKVYQIDSLIFKYELKKKNKIFLTNYEDNKFEKYAKPFLT